MTDSKGGDNLVISKSNYERVSFSKEFISTSKKTEEIPSLFLPLIEIYIIFVRKEKRKMAGLKGEDKLFTSRSNERYLSPFRRKLKRSVPSLFLPYNRYITIYIIYLFEKKKKERWPVRKEGQVIYIEVKPRKSFFLEGSEEIYSFPVSSPNRYITMYIIYLFEKKKERWLVRKDKLFTSKSNERIYLYFEES